MEMRSLRKFYHVTSVDRIRNDEIRRMEGLKEIDDHRQDPQMYLDDDHLIIKVWKRITKTKSHKYRLLVKLNLLISSIGSERYMQELKLRVFCFFSPLCSTTKNSNVSVPVILNI